MGYAKRDYARAYELCLKLKNNSKYREVLEGKLNKFGVSIQKLKVGKTTSQSPPLEEQKSSDLSVTIESNTPQTVSESAGLLTRLLAAVKKSGRFASGAMMAFAFIAVALFLLLRKRKLLKRVLGSLVGMFCAANNRRAV